MMNKKYSPSQEILLNQLKRTMSTHPTLDRIDQFFKILSSAVDAIDAVISLVQRLVNLRRTWSTNGIENKDQEADRLDFLFFLFNH
jgi:hypothetical protein